MLPSFFTRQFTPAEEYDNEVELEVALISEVERFYVFKSIDPKVGFAPAKGGQMLYSAYPLAAIQSMENVFAELKIPLIAIDCNYTAIIRALVSLGLVEREVTEELKWAVVVLSDTTIFMAVIEGQIVEKVLESPLDTTQKDTIMGDIAEDFKQFCGFEVLNKVVIVNNSEKIYSTKLLEVLEFDGPKDIFDQNPNTMKTYGNQDAAYPSSLEAVGGALIEHVDYVPPLDMSSPDSQDVGADEELKNKIAIGIGVAGVVFYAIQMGISTMISGNMENLKRETSKVENKINNQLSSLKLLSDAKQQFYVKLVQDSNITFNNVMIKIAEALPPDAWIKSVKLTTGNTVQSYDMVVEGSALSSGPLNDYLNQIAGQLPAETNLKPQVNPVNKDGNRYFEFKLFSEAKQEPKK